VGVDVSKERLDGALRPSGECFGEANDKRAVSRLVKRLAALSCTRVVIEASGGYETVVVGALYAAGVPVMVVNPRWVRHYAQSIGWLEKTDRIDAKLLAVAHGPPPGPARRARLGADDEDRRGLRLAALHQPTQTGIRICLVWRAGPWMFSKHLRLWLGMGRFRSSIYRSAAEQVELEATDRSRFDSRSPLLFERKSIGGTLHHACTAADATVAVSDLYFAQVLAFFKTRLRADLPAKADALAAFGIELDAPARSLK
jgi:Transposase